MSLPGPNLPILVGQSMSALPGYFRRRPVPLLRGHHRPQCRGIWRCFQSWPSKSWTAR